MKLKKTAYLILMSMSLSANSASKLFTPDQFTALFDEAAIEKVPKLKTTSCKVIRVEKTPNKTITECETVINNSLLTIDASNNKATSVWLMLDFTKLNHPTDLWRSAALLVRVARGGESLGNYLQVGTDTLRGMQQLNGKRYCLDDKESASRLCMETNDGSIYNITLDLPK
jgi:hypothetical protein